MFVLSNKIKYFVSQLPYKISIKDISPINLPVIIAFVNNQTKLEFIKLDEEKDIKTHLPKRSCPLWITTPKSSFIYYPKDGANCLSIMGSPEKLDVSQ